ncbi:MAG: acetyl-CoA carboxylase, carboxyltransferase subunit beta [Chloroflexi bacterium]|nr:acetyl-CoA carboxylase, carboxyltransferase subunit beta [Chloroflexota bacterium]GIW10366.1 MAG: acetyl-coenzyme A carboxylase carboxyl transferase subunit beta [Dehalococcoidia bacterium]
MDRLRRTVTGRRTPPGGSENLWVRCLRCRELNYVRELEDNLKVCVKCGYHFRLSARERVAQLLDGGEFQEWFADLAPADPLRFKTATQSYPTKLAETQRATGLVEAALCGEGKIRGHRVVLAVLDFGFLGGSMGSVVGEKVTRAIEEATRQRLPLIVVSASGGARMYEGAISLMQMAKTSAALTRLGAAGVPYFAVLTDPTTGGVTASFASLGDVTLAEPGALIGFAGPRVIEQVTRQRLPPGFQTAEFLLEHGMIDMVVPRKDLPDTLAKLLSLFPPYGRHEASR